MSDCEFRDDGRGHSYDTMVKLQAEHPEARLYCLVGGDKLNVVSRWHNSRKFFERFEFAVGDDSVRGMLDDEVYELLVKAGWTAMDITSFRGNYHFLSNFFEAPWNSMASAA